MFETYLEKYAELAVKVGVNVQPGQRLLLINVPLEAALLARAITKQAYLAGARDVNVLWTDEYLRLLQVQHGTREGLGEFPTWTVTAMQTIIDGGGAILSINGRDPDLMSGQDPEALKIIQRTTAQQMMPVNQLTSKMAMNWTVIGAAVPGWAKKVFPDLPIEQAIEQLWEAIFAVCRLYESDPVAAWEHHIDQLNQRIHLLNEKAYTALHYRAAGTDLTVGLPAGHRWLGGRTTAQSGIPCVPNLPTEEVFTLPHKDRVDGIVTSTKPLAYQGMLIENFTLKFENGRVVEARAEKGEAELNSLISTDEGAARLGEVALVANSSPVSQRGVLFYNMLYDENASCHLALGRAYNLNLDPALSQDEFAAAGGNISLIHTDFMMGSAALDIDGIRADGRREPLFRAGEWAL